MEAEELNREIFNKISDNDKEEIKAILKLFEKETINVITIL